MAKVMIGVISCLADNTMCLEDRVKMHAKQLRKFENYMAYMQETYDEDILPFYRVEQGWNEIREEVLTANFPIQSIKFANPIPPGAARNELLKVLYSSDYDWLVCLDDDHSIIPTYLGQELLWELSEPEFTAFAETGYLINAIPGYHSAYNKKIQDWGKADTHWLFEKSTHVGALALCCIPNLVKYGMQPVFFDGQTTIIEEGAPPEDLKFAFDWIINGGALIECWQLISTATGDLQKSSIFETEDERRRKIKEYANQWVGSYLKQHYPRNPALWTKKEFLARKNSPVRYEIRRAHEHSFKK